MRAKKSLGQNFLQDEQVVTTIVDALEISPEDIVVEIGPGRGALTDLLVKRAQRVVAVEFDRELIAPLRVQFGCQDNFELIAADALFFDFSQIGPSGQKSKLVANLPYNISTPILQSLIKQRASFSTIVLMFQREVADRLTAEPGQKQRGYLSVLVEDAFETEKLFDVPPSAFRPVPKVWSSVVRLTPQMGSFSDPAVFRNLLGVAFEKKRKTILNNLRTVYETAGSLLEEADIDPIRRAETLSLAEWYRLANGILQIKNQ
ncbi:MAG: 16S rRNA (adenine(1518)-N(6)/adenine(1519)-N(6))-dimethyltransferase RsmA [Pyrinomonadaceae bacterium]